MKAHYLTDLNLDSILEDLNNFDVVSLETLQLIYWGAKASSTYKGAIGSESYDIQNAFIDKIEKAIRART